VTRRRLWLFRIAAATLVPAAFFVLAELALRACGVGRRTTFFVEAKGGRSYTADPSFGWQFFEREGWPAPWPTRLPMDKSPGAYRVFILGGSAAMGSPDPSFAFWRILEEMLQARYPGAEIEVVNTAMAAINSHVVRQIARESARHEPDLFVVYLGNNEVVGPFGPGTVFAGFSSSRRLIHLGLWTRTTRVGQLLRRLLRGALPAAEGGEPTGTGMELFVKNRVRADDPRMETVYAHLRANLLDIIAAARSAGAKVVLSTVATNIRDCAPFASQHRTDLAVGEAAEWERAYQRGTVVESGGDLEGAIGLYRQAAAVDDTYADLSFRLGRCHLALGDLAAARDCFIRARDLDALRFRADTRVNRVIREVATDAAPHGVYLVDAQDAFESSRLTLHRMPGEELLLEHVHMNFAGNYLLARLVLNAIDGIAPEAVRRHAAGSGPPLSRDECADRMLFTGLDEWQLYWTVAKSMERPPFTYQLDHAQRLNGVYRRIVELEGNAALDNVEAVLEHYREAIARRPDDYLLRHRFGIHRKLRDQLLREARQEQPAALR
jgi:tetratricopeptide (TPR) repeat protein